MKLLRAVAALSMLIGGSATAQQVRTYASQVNDVDAVNTHWFATDIGVVVIDAQRILPEAERAIQHLRATTAEPVVAIIVTLHTPTTMAVCQLGGRPFPRPASTRTR